MLQQGRIDFIRIINDTEDVHNTLEWQLMLEGVAAQITLDNGWVGKKQMWAKGSYYNTYIKRHVAFFDCWGLLSDVMADHITPVDWRDVRRLDWRTEMTEGHMPVRSTLAYAEEVQSGSRGTVHYYSSPPRQKRYDRDVGGTTVSVGARNTDCRAVFYQRKGERAALECQFEKANVQDIVNRAFAKFSAARRVTGAPRLSLADNVRIELDASHDVWVVRKFGLNRYQMSGEMPINTPITFDGDTPERLTVANFIRFWAEADEPTKRAIRKVVRGVYKIEYDVVK